MNEPVSFRLFLAGSNANSREALVNLQSFCEEFLPGRYTIHTVDVFEHPELALQEGIILTPALVIDTVDPPRVLVGNLSRRHILLEALGLS